MSFSYPTIELDLYRVEIIHEISLIKDGDLPIVPDYSDSPFQHPEIMPSARVGRWYAYSTMDSYVELDVFEPYKIKLYNYTSKRCNAKVYINEVLVGRWIMNPRKTITIDRPQNSKSGEIFRFSRMGTQSDLIEVKFQPEHLTERNMNDQIYGERCPPSLLVVEPIKETIMYIRLVAKRRYMPFASNIAFREFCS